MDYDQLSARIQRLEKFCRGESNSDQNNITLIERIKKIKTVLNSLSLENKQIKDFLKKYSQLSKQNSFLVPSSKDETTVESVEYLRAKAEVILVMKTKLERISELLERIEKNKGFAEFRDFSEINEIQFKNKLYKIQNLHLVQLNETKRLASELMQNCQLYFQQLITMIRIFLVFDASFKCKNSVLPFHPETTNLSKLKKLIISILLNTSKVKHIDLYLMKDDDKFLLSSSFSLKHQLRDGDLVAVDKSGSKYSDTSSSSEDESSSDSSEDDTSTAASDSSMEHNFNDSKDSSSSSNQNSSPEELPILPDKVSPIVNSTIGIKHDKNNQPKQTPSPRKDLVENIRITNCRPPPKGEPYFENEPFSAEDLSFDVASMNTEIKSNNVRNHFITWDQVYRLTYDEYYAAKKDIIDQNHYYYSTAPKKKKRRTKAQQSFNGSNSNPTAIVNDREDSSLSSDLVVDFDSFPSYDGLPNENDEILFRVLEVDFRTFTPKISDFKQARIISYNAESDTVKLQILKVFKNHELDSTSQKHPKRKLPSQVFAESAIETQTEFIEVEWKTLTNLKRATI